MGLSAEVYFREIVDLTKITELMIRLGFDVKYRPNVKRRKNYQPSWVACIKRGDAPIGCSDNSRSFDVKVENTAEVLYDCEEFLVNSNLLPEDVPKRIIVNASWSDQVDFDITNNLCETFKKELGGILKTSAC